MRTTLSSLSRGAVTRATLSLLRVLAAVVAPTVAAAQGLHFMQMDVFRGDVDGAALGTAVAIDGRTAVASTQVEEVYVFVQNGLRWVFQQKLISPTSGISFGLSVAISGDTIAVGAPADGAGAVYVYRRAGATWVLEKRITPTPAVLVGVDPARFGESVALHGDTLVVGAPSSDTRRFVQFSIAVTQDAGGVWILDRAGGAWPEVAILSGNGTNAEIGWAVAVDGSLAAAGGRNSLAIYRYQNGWQPGVAVTPPNSCLYVSVALRGTRLSAACRGYGAPALHYDIAPSVPQPYLLARSVSELKDSNGNNYGHQSVALMPYSIFPSETVPVAGANEYPRVDGSFVPLGFAQLFEFAVAAQPTPADPQSDFGRALAASGTVLVVGDRGRPCPGCYPRGAVYFFEDDSDRDGMPFAWEVPNGLDVFRDDAGIDSDFDGVLNLDEYRNETHPLLPNVWYLAEGATGFFEDRYAIANPGPGDADFELTLLTGTGASFTRPYSLPAFRRLTIDARSLLGDVPAEVSAIVRTLRGGVVAERTMRWDARSGLPASGHTAKGVIAPRTRWYLAEGEARAFETFILLANANSVATTVELLFLLDTGAPVVVTRVIPPGTRDTVWANTLSGVAGHAFSVVVTSQHPIACERAMYMSTPGAFFRIGHASPAIPGLSTDWFVAEGTTAWLFDEFLLLANPQATDVTAKVQFLKPDGQVVVVNYALPQSSRTTIWVNHVPGLQNTDVSATVAASAPILVERAMYWPRPHWYEGHSAAGVTRLGTWWALAEGEVGGPDGFETYLLFANPTTQDAAITLTLLREGAPPLVRTLTVRAQSRYTVAASTLGLASGERFGALVASSELIVVERAMYWQGAGQFFGGGTDETAFRLR